MNNEQQSPAPESQSQRERDQVFYSREYCRNCGHKHGSGPCGWDAGAGMCGCLEFVDKGPDWPGGPISPTREDGPANSDASEKEGREGCCAARKALEAARMALRDAAYGMSEGSLEDIRNLGVPLALRAMEEVDAVLAAPCECERDNVLAQQLRDACDKLKSLCLRWNKMASHFTAGSEFVDDPERVGKALESRFRLQRGIHEAIQAKLCDEVKRLQAAVELHKGAAEELRSQLAKQESANV